MRVTDPTQLEILRKTSVLDRISSKPYPQERAVQADIEDMLAARPDLKADLERKRSSDFIDNSPLKEMEAKNFFSRLY